MCFTLAGLGLCVVCLNFIQLPYLWKDIISVGVGGYVRERANFSLLVRSLLTTMAGAGKVQS